MTVTLLVLMFQPTDVTIKCHLNYVQLIDFWPKDIVSLVNEVTYWMKIKFGLVKMKSFEHCGFVKLISEISTDNELCIKIN
jgi:hypothetical protein